MFEKLKQRFIEIETRIVEIKMEIERLTSELFHFQGAKAECASMMQEVLHPAKEDILTNAETNPADNQPTKE